MKIRCLYFMVLLNSLSAWDFVKDYPYREGSYPPFELSENQRILLLTPPRTGSTFVYNILAYLFEDINFSHISHNFNQKRVVKSHTQGVKLRNYDCLFISAKRSPLDMFDSISRTNHIPMDMQNIKKLKYVSNAKPIYHYLSKKPLSKVLFLTYEKFVDNINYLFDELEGFFSIEIPHEMRKKIEQMFSKEEMLKIQNRYKDFSQYDLVTGIHGAHIDKNHDSKNSSALTNSQIKQQFFDIYKMWGYSN
ncbi:MAG: hypothetical protein WDZ28_01195 [Simkaniaceae bacterium]